MAPHSTQPYPTPLATPPNEASNTVNLSHLPADITVLVSSRAVLPTHSDITPATLILSQSTGKIHSIYPTIVPRSSFPTGTSYTDYTPHVLLPGLVDAHVHLNEPGRTEWEGFWTGTRAAAFGGVTTVIDMPLNAIPPTTTVAGLKEKVEAAKGKCWVDVGFYGGVVPGNEGELLGLVNGGVRGFKGFLIDSGVPEFPAISAAEIATAMLTLSSTPTTLMFHAEMVPPISASVGDDVQTSLPPLAPSGPLTTYRTFLDSRPPALETYAVDEILSLAPLAPNLHLHIVHLSAVEVIPLLREARRKGINITAETCFHYLALAAEGIAEGDTRHKCCPPIRGKENQDGLWEELLRSGYQASTPAKQITASATGLATPATTVPSTAASYTSLASLASETDNDGVIKTVVSDHSPCTAGLKLLPSSVIGHDRDATHPTPSSAIPPCHPPPSPEEVEKVEKGDFFTAWGGISSVGLGLPILWSQKFPHLLSRHGHARSHKHGAKRDFTLHDVVQWCSTATAAQVGLSHLKGRLEAGLDADVIVFDDEAEWTLGVEKMLFRNKCSPYEGRKLRGVVRETWVRGRRVFVREGDEGGEGVGSVGFDEERGPEGRLLLERRTE